MAQQRFFKKHFKLTLLFTIITGCLFILFGFEGMIFLFLRFPILNNYFPFFKSTITEVYFSRDRNILQFMSRCTRYDPEVSYTLKPGEWDFSNREFCNHYHVNSIGLRDTESSLDKPEIIVLGDSYAMGWGVEQNETFSQVLENLTGKKVLNAGVSSYGTAREMLFTKRLDLSNVKYLVIQYSNNDFEENSYYIENNFNLQIMTEQDYNKQCSEHENRKRYTLLLFTQLFLKQFIPQFKSYSSHTQSKVALSSLTATKEAEQTIQKSDAEIFLQIISRQNFENIQLIVLNLSHYSLNTRIFIETLASLKKDNNYPAFIQNLKLINAASFLEKSDYYIIDDHLNKYGHLKVANALLKLMQTE